MIDLSTKYMGLDLKNPIIVGSCGLTGSVDSIQKLEKSGAAAIVLKSIFEEQILMEGNSVKSGYMAHAEEDDYIKSYTRSHNLDKYLTLVKDAKKNSAIPIIASINCISSAEWTAFAAKIQDAGADALELNMFLMPGNPKQSGRDIEETYFKIIDDVRNYISIPLSIKVGSYFSGMANMIFQLSVRKIDGIVLFNRFHQPDIDLDKMELVTGDVFSTATDNTHTLRWIGMLSDVVKCDLAASTGIHDGDTVVKNLLAGAKAVQVVSNIYKHGPDAIGHLINQVKKRLKTRNFGSISDIIGKLSQSHIKDPMVYERSQFMKYFSDNTSTAGAPVGSPY